MFASLIHIVPYPLCILYFAVALLADIIFSMFTFSPYIDVFDLVTYVSLHNVSNYPLTVVVIVYSTIRVRTYNHNAQHVRAWHGVFKYVGVTVYVYANEFVQSFLLSSLELSGYRECM